MSAYERLDFHLPWYASQREEKRFKRILLYSLLVLSVVSLIVPFIPVPELTREERESLPPQLARITLEEQPAPEPEPQVREPEPQSEPEQPEPAEETTEAPETPPDTGADSESEARERAASSGVLQFRDDLAAMRDSVDLSQVEQSNLTRNDAQAEQLERSLVTSGATATSGGVNDDELSRDTGGTALSGRETTRVESEMADRDLAARREAERQVGQRRSDEEIRRVVDRNKDAIYAIYNRALRSNPSLAGKVTVRLTIEPSGEITEVELIASELENEELERRLVTRIRLIAFEAKEVIRTVANYTFDFLPY